MKAKEYAKIYLESEDKAVGVFEIIRDILFESQQIIKDRHIKRVSALLDVFDELEKKWQAVVRRANIPLKDEKDPFHYIFKKFMPEIYNEWELHKIRHKVRSESFRK